VAVLSSPTIIAKPVNAQPPSSDGADHYIVTEVSLVDALSGASCPLGAWHARNYAMSDAEVLSPT
jgi:hypothetical protein